MTELPKFINDCIEICEDRKAQDILVYDVRGTSILADFYVICSGSSTPHIRAISDHLERAFKDQGQRPKAVEGIPASHWIIMDYSDVLIHIFHGETRAHYQIEALLDPAMRVYGTEEEDDDEAKESS